jgi:hypothetical protein
MRAGTVAGGRWQAAGGTWQVAATKRTCMQDAEAELVARQYFVLAPARRSSELPAPASGGRASASSC